MERSGSLIGSGSPLYVGRRPDIASIELSCDNSDIPLPHVDLVNEILEHSVASQVLDDPPDYPDHIKTTGTADELAAVPAPLHGHSPATDPRATAYLALANDIYPWAVPWSFWAEEARVYLDHLGVPRHALMWTLRTLDGSSPSAADIASERLGLSERERQVIIGGTISPAPGGLYAYWGLANTGALSTLTSVPVFLARSGLTYDDLLELLDTRFLSQFGDLSLTASLGTDACNPDNQIISGITVGQESNAWTAIHRFLRLQRRIGYSIRELDQAYIAFGASTIDDAFLETLGAVERFRAAWQSPGRRRRELVRRSRHAAEGRRQDSIVLRAALPEQGGHEPRRSGARGGFWSPIRAPPSCSWTTLTPSPARSGSERRISRS
ncbi:MAG: hypothetical protein QM744_04325 [Mesorhizobium sp.]